MIKHLTLHDQPEPLAEPDVTPKPSLKRAMPVDDSPLASKKKKTGRGE